MSEVHELRLAPIDSAPRAALNRKGRTLIRTVEEDCGTNEKALLQVRPGGIELADGGRDLQIWVVFSEFCADDVREGDGVTFTGVGDVAGVEAFDELGVGGGVGACGRGEHQRRDLQGREQDLHDGRIRSRGCGRGGIAASKWRLPGRREA